METDTQQPVDTRAQGTVEKIIYHDAQSDFSILLLKHSSGRSFISTGSFPLVVCGHLLTLSGKWVLHPRFGRQFETSSFYTTTPTSRTGLITFLSSGLVKGIGESLAAKIVDTFGTDTLRIIEEEPHKLGAMAGLGPKRIAALEQAWATQKEFAHLLLFLQGKGIRATHAAKLYKQYGNRTLATITENPYHMIDDIWGIGFTVADEIAQKLGIQKDAPLRITAGIRHCLRRAAQGGHLYLLERKLYEQACELLGITPEALHEQLHQLIARKQLMMLDQDGTHFIALAAAYDAEQSVAQRLALLQSTPPCPHIIPDTARLQLQKGTGAITLNEEQTAAIMTILREPITIITGGPGTGKTTLLSVLIEILSTLSISYKLAAPTGRAARRISEKTQRAAVTLHRLLDFDPESGLFKVDGTHPLTARVIIVDECSMIDIMLAQALLRSVPPGSRLVLIGDSDQLPSVGPGNFLHDCLESQRIPTVRLVQIFRQAAGSMISYNAHRIREGKFPIEQRDMPMTDFKIILETDPEKLTAHIERIITLEAPRYGCTPADSMVLCPMHRGLAGTQQINQFLQRILNIQAGTSFISNGVTYRCNDRVMQLRNNYDKGVFNGDIGTITHIDLEEQCCSVSYEGRAVCYQFDETHELTLAYATSIHKSQGSEFPLVIIPLFMQHYLMLRRNLLYTAITRAEKLCIIIGEKRAISLALRPLDQENRRLTLLATLLADQITLPTSSCIE